MNSNTAQTWRSFAGSLPMIRRETKGLRIVSHLDSYFSSRLYAPSSENDRLISNWVRTNRQSYTIMLNHSTPLIRSLHSPHPLWFQVKLRDYQGWKFSCRQCAPQAFHHYLINAPFHNRSTVRIRKYFVYVTHPSKVPSTNRLTVIVSPKRRVKVISSFSDLHFSSPVGRKDSCPPCNKYFNFNHKQRHTWNILWLKLNDDKNEISSSYFSICKSKTLMFSWSSKYIICWLI